MLLSTGLMRLLIQNVRGVVRLVRQRSSWLHIPFFPALTLQEVLDRKTIIAQQYGFYLSDETDLFDFFYLSSQAKKQKQDKAQAYKDGKVWLWVLI